MVDFDATQVNRIERRAGARDSGRLSFEYNGGAIGPGMQKGGPI